MTDQQTAPAAPLVDQARIDAVVAEAHRARARMLREAFQALARTLNPARLVRGTGKTSRA